MAIAKKVMGFPSDLVSFSTELSSKRHAKFHITFFTGYIHKYYASLQILVYRDVTNVPHCRKCDRPPNLTAIYRPPNFKLCVDKKGFFNILSRPSTIHKIYNLWN